MSQAISNLATLLRSMEPMLHDGVYAYCVMANDADLSALTRRHELKPSVRAPIRFLKMPNVVNQLTAERNACVTVNNRQI